MSANYDMGKFYAQEELLSKLGSAAELAIGLGYSSVAIDAVKLLEAVSGSECGRHLAVEVMRCNITRRL